MKQQNLKEHRNYEVNPRRSTERDPEFRGDITWFEESRTKQADAESADINVLMAKYGHPSLIPFEAKEALQGDFSTMETYHEAQEIVAQANSAFAGLPAQVRAAFNNDPSIFLNYIDEAPSNPKAMAKLVEMGLAEIVEAPETPHTAPSAASMKKKGAGATAPVSDDPEAD